MAIGDQIPKGRYRFIICSHRPVAGLAKREIRRPAGPWLQQNGYSEGPIFANPCPSALGGLMMSRRRSQPQCTRVATRKACGLINGALFC